MVLIPATKRWGLTYSQEILGGHGKRSLGGHILPLWRMTSAGMVSTIFIYVPPEQTSTNDVFGHADSTLRSYDRGHLRVIPSFDRTEQNTTTAQEQVIWVAAIGRRSWIPTAGPATGEDTQEATPPSSVGHFPLGSRRKPGPKLRCQGQAVYVRYTSDERANSASRRIHASPTARCTQRAAASIRPNLRRRTDIRNDPPPSSSHS